MEHSAFAVCHFLGKALAKNNAFDLAKNVSIIDGNSIHHHLHCIDLYADYWYRQAKLAPNSPTGKQLDTVHHNPQDGDDDAKLFANLLEAKLFSIE